MWKWFQSAPANVPYWDNCDIDLYQYLPSWLYLTVDQFYGWVKPTTHITLKWQLWNKYHFSGLEDWVFFYNSPDNFHNNHHKFPAKKSRRLLRTNHTQGTCRCAKTTMYCSSTSKEFWFKPWEFWFKPQPAIVSAKYHQHEVVCRSQIRNGFFHNPTVAQAVLHFLPLFGSHNSPHLLSRMCSMFYSNFSNTSRDVLL